MTRLRASTREDRGHVRQSKPRPPMVDHPVGVSAREPDPIYRRGMRKLGLLIGGGSAIAGAAVGIAIMYFPLRAARREQKACEAELIAQIKILADIAEGNTIERRTWFAREGSKIEGLTLFAGGPESRNLFVTHAGGCDEGTLRDLIGSAKELRQVGFTLVTCYPNSDVGFRLQADGGIESLATAR